MAKSIYYVLACALAPLLASAQTRTAFYGHIFFDNSATPDRYFYSQGQASGASRLEVIEGRLPVETARFRTPPNALRLRWTSARDGAWDATVSLDRWRERGQPFAGDTLSFWVYSAAALPAAALPRLQIANWNAGFSSLLDISRIVPSLPAARWTRVAIPLARFERASRQAFDPRKMETLSFVQGAADGLEHTLILDEIRIDSSSAAPRKLAAPLNLRATGYERHVDLTWDRDPAAERYLVYRSAGGSRFEPAGMEEAGSHRYADWVGEPGRKRFYKVVAIDGELRESAPSAAVEASTRNMTPDELLTMLQEASFRYFHEAAHPASGMALENIPGDPNMVAVGASGFGIMALIAGAERGFTTKAEVAAHLEKIVSFLERAQRFHGAYPHFADGRTGRPVLLFGRRDNGADLVETAFLMQGLLAARQYLAGRAELARRITRLWEAVEWDWFRGSPAGSALLWHWSPDFGFSDHPLVGWNETLIAYLLAIASPTHPVPPSLYHDGWAGQTERHIQYRRGWGQTEDGDRYTNGKSYYGIPLDVGVGTGGPLFFTHYSLLGFDPRGIRDRYTNYFTNSKAQVLINRAYCIANPQRFAGYAPDLWGLTASDDPGGYSAHWPHPKQDNGTIAPTAALSSFPYAPEESMAVFLRLYRQYGDRLWGVYGFRDALNLQQNWFARLYLALDQAPIAVMAENHRSGLLWKLFMSNPEIRPALDEIGFRPE